MERFDIKTTYNNLKDFEMFLFSIKCNKPLEIFLSFYDNNSIYEYQTQEVNGDLVFVTR